jgi:fructoselysine-6-P-deglycase FrlB-like protein
MAHTPPLISLEEIEAQSSVLRALSLRIGSLPRLAESTAPLVFVGEGSSYNAMDWQLHSIRRMLPQLKIRLMYPWELDAYLEDSPILTGNATAPILVAVSQSGRTASLRRAVKHYFETVPHAPKGWLITNSPEAGQHTDWQHMQVIPLEAGEENAIAATKTFTATAYMIRALLLPEDTTLQLDLIPIGIATLLQALPHHPQWLNACELIRQTMERPMVLIGSKSTMPVLGELHLKLTETLSRPVLTYHNEGFKHGPRSILHRDQQPHWPLQIFFPPEHDQQRHEYEADARLHVEHLPPASHPDLYQLWIRPNHEADPLDAGQAAMPTLRGANIVELSVPGFISSDLMALVIIQRLAYEVVTQLNLKADGLTKFIGEDAPALPWGSLISKPQEDKPD